MVNVGSAGVAPGFVYLGVGNESQPNPGLEAQKGGLGLISTSIPQPMQHPTSIDLEQLRTSGSQVEKPVVYTQRRCREGGKRPTTA